jgi:drug/metabolite transporter (DMT)-like permease
MAVISIQSYKESNGRRLDRCVFGISDLVSGPGTFHSLAGLLHLSRAARHRRIQMKGASIAGILLIVLGVIALAYQGITYTTQKKILDIGPVQATKEEHKTIPLPPIVGGLALVGGIALLATGGRNS